jgi:hypothetical protein
MLGLFKRETSKIEEVVRKAVAEVMEEQAKATAREIGSLSSIQRLRAEKEKLETEIAELKTQKKQDAREIEHKVGLAKIRQEAEAEIADKKLKARETELERTQKVAVQEAKVAAKEEAMKRADELLGQQVARMEKLVDTLVGALPKAEMMMTVERGRK